MEGETLPTDIRIQLANWERSLLLISIPHGAAFGAVLGKFNFNDPSRSPDMQVLALLTFMSILPMTAFWLAAVHDLLRTTFLAAGHMGTRLRLKHTIRFLITGFFPLIIIVLVGQSPSSSDGQMYSLIGLILMMWWMSARIVSGKLYEKIVSALGVKVDV